MASLKQSIVVRNEFSVRDKGSGKGSRGSSPSGYIDYMTRDRATEGVSPVRLREQDGVLDRHDAQDAAVLEDGDVPTLKHKLRLSQQRAGVAFCNGDASMSAEKLLAKKKEAEEAFAQNKTWMKTVLSFSPEYLEEMGIVEPGFRCTERGGYRGHVDQVKLRLAIMHGLDKAARGRFQDLQYVGVIQVDTWHVHCHLSMYDAGVGEVHKVSGRQNGSLSPSVKQRLRRGVDEYLDENHTTRQLTSNVQHDKRAAVCYVKRFTYRAMEERGLAQFLMACLPDDRRLWRADTNRKEMKKPNYIIRSYVNDLLARPGSGYQEALSAVDRYACRRQKREGLSHAEYRTLYRRGQEGIITDCINGVYSALKRVPRKQQTVQTSMMAAMAQSYEDMADEAISDPMIEFGFRLRSYSTRVEHHRKEKDRYKEMVRQAESQRIDESARPFVDFLRFEQTYNEMLMAKYQHFLAFLPPDAEFRDEFQALLRRKRRIDGIDLMLGDPSMKRMLPDNAESYGRKVYDLRGGRYVVTAPEILTQRRDELREVWRTDADAFRDKLADHALVMDETKDGQLQVHKGTAYAFDSVKALDLHHLSFDFPVDVPVSRVNADRFVSFAKQRYELFQGAKAYLESSGQAYGVALLPVRDVENMKVLADRIQTNPVLVREHGSKGVKKSGKTVSLDKDLREDIDRVIRMSIDAQIEMMQ